MALVAYDYGSDSDKEITDEEVDDTSGSKVILNEQKTTGIQTTPNSSNNSVPTENGDSTATTSLFSHLPQAKLNKPDISEENDQLEDFIPTVNTLKEKKKVLITIPSLSDFNDPDTEEPEQKRIKPSQTGSGLLSMLPPVQTVPRSNISFIPNTLRKPSEVASTSKSLVPDSVKRAQATKKSSSVKTVKRKTESDGSDSDDNDVPDTFDDQMWEKVCGRPKPKPVVQKDLTLQEPEVEISSAPEAKKPYEGLDNVAFKELVGKTKRPIGNIKLIDINEEEILPDRDLWMTKSLTDPELAPKPEPEEQLDPTKKRKHHITYLAQQARANEQELKSAWATSRNNRMMSRSKYGF